MADEDFCSTKTSFMLRTLSCLKIRRNYDRRKIQRPAHRALLERQKYKKGKGTFGMNK